MEWGGVGGMVAGIGPGGPVGSGGGAFVALLDPCHHSFVKLFGAVSATHETLFVKGAVKAIFGKDCSFKVCARGVFGDEHGWWWGGGRLPSR